jgi:hypothetical protein
MTSRVAVLARVALLAAAFATIGFGAASFGVFGPVPPTTAILETTSQSPVEIVPRPSPGVVPAGDVPAARPSDARPLVAALATAGVIATVLLIRQRR